MKRFLFICVVLLVGAVFGQSPDLSQPSYVAQSSTLLIRFYPGSKTGKIFLVGKKAADLNLRQDAQLVSVTLFNDGKKEELKMSHDGTGYLVESTGPFPRKYELNLRAEVRGELQQMKIQVDSKP